MLWQQGSDRIRVGERRWIDRHRLQHTLLEDASSRPKHSRKYSRRIRCTRVFVLDAGVVGTQNPGYGDVAARFCFSLFCGVHPQVTEESRLQGKTLP